MDADDLQPPQRLAPTSIRRGPPPRTAAASSSSEDDEPEAATPKKKKRGYDRVQNDDDEPSTLEPTSSTTIKVDKLLLIRLGLILFAVAGYHLYNKLVLPDDGPAPSPPDPEQMAVRAAEAA